MIHDISKMRRKWAAIREIGGFLSFRVPGFEGRRKEGRRANGGKTNLSGMGFPEEIYRVLRDKGGGSGVWPTSFPAADFTSIPPNPGSLE